MGEQIESIFLNIAQKQLRLDINADGRYREEDNYLVYKEGFSYEIFNIFELGILPIAWPYYYTRIYPKSTNQSRSQVQLLLIHFKTQVKMPVCNLYANFNIFYVASFHQYNTHIYYRRHGMFKKQYKCI